MQEFQNLYHTLRLRYHSNFVHDDTIHEFEYPVMDYPLKVKSVNFDKQSEVEGRLWGIKGQYLIFDDGRVFNVRRHNGYLTTLEI